MTSASIFSIRRLSRSPAGPSRIWSAVAPSGTISRGIGRSRVVFWTHTEAQAGLRAAFPRRGADPQAGSELSPPGETPSFRALAAPVSWRAMKLFSALVVLLLAAAGCASAPVATDPFEARFTGRVVRFDYHHAGNATEEHIAPAGLRLEGAWPGSRTALVDATNLGKYLFEVREPSSGELMFSRGFCSIFGEWETTGEAKQVWKAFEESQRFPEPRGKVRLALRKRAGDGTFAAPFFELEVDPASRFVDRAPLREGARVLPIHETGPVDARLDLLVLAEGYTRAEELKFEADAKRLSKALLATPPFSTRSNELNVRGLFVASPHSGIRDPRRELWNETAFGASFNAFDSDRYVLTYRDRELRELAAAAPYDFLVILFNGRKYGGGGIYNLWATCASDTSVAEYVFVHELGHSLGGLADEYYSSPVSYEEFTPPGSEPWEPNVTALREPWNLKWRELVERGTPLPTPWDKGPYDEEDRAFGARRAELAKGRDDGANEALFAEIKLASGARLARERFAGKVGAFEGAAYEARGLYRPSVDCIMFTRNPTTFCAVCERAIARVIDAHAR
ncbi:MAG: peptidase M64 [Planctomycetes bacterium]|nr:peptidase M64 [Planctomycetota bacterium]